MTRNLDILNARTLALVITDNPLREMPLRLIGTTWAPRDDRTGQHWSERKCREVLQQMLDFGYCRLRQGALGMQVQVTAAGVAALDLAADCAAAVADQAENIRERIEQLIDQEEQQAS
ncbi:MAG: hypothetical protein ABF296_07510 [Oceanococcaceae bacterium]